VCRRSPGWREGEDHEKNRSLGDMRAAVASNTSILGPNGYSGGAPSPGTGRGRLGDLQVVQDTSGLTATIAGAVAGTFGGGPSGYNPAGSPRRWVGTPQRLLEIMKY
jgi:hypothetical protein